MSVIWCFLVPNSTEFADETVGYGLGGQMEFVTFGDKKS